MPDKTLNHAGVTTSTCRHRGRCREPYTADPDNFDRVGILWGSLQTFFSVKLMESRAFKQKSAAFWERGQNGSKTLIRASNRATNRYFRRTIRAANLLFDARLFYQGQPFLDQFAKPWAHWKEDTQIFQISARKWKLVQNARRYGENAPFAPKRRAFSP